MTRSRLANLAIISTLMLSLFGAMGAKPAQAQTAERCFAETKQCISGRFRQYWEQNGGLAVFGFPIGPAKNEVNRDTGQTYLTQWFERNRFELHSENKAPYDVLLGRLGDDALRAQGRDWTKEPRVAARPDCLYFAETGHNVCNQAGNLGIKSYWQSNGLEFDGRAGKSHGESLALFGLPLTEPKMETNASGDTVMTQWFERGRFEWHPEQADPKYRLLLGLLGNETRGAPVQTSLPTNVPWIHTGNRVIAATQSAPSVTLAQTTQNGAPFYVMSAPNGSRLAYAEITAQNYTVLRMVDNASGRRSGPSYNAAKAIAFEGVWSPDGKQYAYTLIYSGNEPTFELHIYNAETGVDVVRRTETTRLIPAFTAWNANGLFARIVYWQSDAPVQGIVEVMPATGDFRPVIDGANYGLAIHPSGQSVALVTGEVVLGGPSKTQLTVRDRKSGKSTTVVPQGTYFISDPQWSASGAKLLYSRFDTPGDGASSVRVVNPDGTGEQVLRLDSGAFPGRLIDIAWRGSDAVLLLTQDGPEHISLFEVSLSNFHPAKAKLLQTVRQDGGGRDQIVYVP